MPVNVASWRTILVTLIVAVVCVGCGEPGEPSPDIGLYRTTDDRLLLAYRICPGARVEEFLVGNNLDQWAEPTLRLRLKETPADFLEIDLASPDSKQFRAERSDPGLKLDAPLFARVKSSLGEQGQVFDALPPKGMLMYEPFNTREYKNTTLEEFQSSPPEECPD